MNEASNETHMNVHYPEDHVDQLEHSEDLDPSYSEHLNTRPGHEHPRLGAVTNAKKVRCHYTRLIEDFFGNCCRGKKLTIFFYYYYLVVNSCKTKSMSVFSRSLLPRKKLMH